MTFTRRGVTLTSLPRREQRFTPTRPPPTGRPTRRDRTTNTIDGDPARPTDPAAAEPDPPLDDLPF